MIQPSEQENQSEVARLLAQIECEYLAATRGLTGLAATGKHEVIAARTANMSRLHGSLRALVGDEAIRLVAERLDKL